MERIGRLAPLVALGALVPILCLAAEWRGKVVGVSDGDTIRVMHEGKAEKIRLESIDCPESSQAFGEKAKQETSRLCFGLEVTVRVTGRDRYGRTLAEILLPDGKSLNEELLRNGFAWHYRKYSDSERLQVLEDEAREAKRGLWADPEPVAPWDYRHPKATTMLTSGPLNALGLVGLPVFLAVGPSPENKVDPNMTVYVTKTGTKYHLGGCGSLRKSSIPMALKDAVNSYGPCGNCNPPTLEASSDAPPPPSTGQEVKPTPKPSPSPAGGGQCGATTKKGTRCSRRAAPGSNYCWQHGGK